MDSYQSFLVHRLFVKYFLGVGVVFPCTDYLLETLVNNQIINSSERYLVFSHPIPTKFFNVARYFRLFEILRNSGKFLRFIKFLCTKISGYPEITGFLENLRAAFVQEERLLGLVTEF